MFEINFKVLISCLFTWKGKFYDLFDSKQCFIKN